MAAVVVEMRNKGAVRFSVKVLQADRRMVEIRGWRTVTRKRRPVED